MAKYINVEMSEAFFVEVLDEESGEIVKRVECSSERGAERVELGMLVNMNRDKFYTRIVKGKK